MKKLFLSLVAIFGFSAAIADDRPVDYSQFPKAAKEFIVKHFPKVQVTSAMLDDDGEYTAYLSDGAKVEFSPNGNWKEVDCRGNEVPRTIIPKAIATYVDSNYARVGIRKIETNNNNYEVKLANGLELKFDMKGNFLGIDD